MKPTKELMILNREDEEKVAKLLGMGEDIRPLAVIFELKPIPSFPGYYAGNDGSIYSTIFSNRWNKEGHYRKLSPGKQKNGYLKLVLIRNDDKINVMVHTLICEAFHGPRPEGTDCSHKDDDKNNNRPTNLCWETPLENQRRRHENGIDDRGVKNTRASLTEETLHQVRNWLEEGKTTVWIAHTLGVSRPVISRVKNGRRYQNDG
jgi:hypothetical protein